jgi:hypothetical protein
MFRFATAQARVPRDVFSLSGLLPRVFANDSFVPRSNDDSNFSMEHRQGWQAHDRVVAAERRTAPGGRLLELEPGVVQDLGKRENHHCIEHASA